MTFTRNMESIKHAKLLKRHGFFTPYSSLSDVAQSTLLAPVATLTILPATSFRVLLRAVGSVIMAAASLCSLNISGFLQNLIAAPLLALLGAGVLTSTPFYFVASIAQIITRTLATLATLVSSIANAFSTNKSESLASGVETEKTIDTEDTEVPAHTLATVAA